jgi:hypothetical protein
MGSATSEEKEWVDLGLTPSTLTISINLKATGITSAVTMTMETVTSSLVHKNMAMIKTPADKLVVTTNSSPCRITGGALVITRMEHPPMSIMSETITIAELVARATQWVDPGLMLSMSTSSISKETSILLRIQPTCTHQKMRVSNSLSKASTCSTELSLSRHHQM